MRALTLALLALLAGWAAASDLDADAQKKLALGEIAAGKIEPAVRRLEKVVLDVADRADVYALLGVAYRMAGRLGEAQEAFENAVASDAAYGPAHAGLADLLLRAGKAEEALTECHQALGTDPRNVTARALKGEALVVLGRRDEARVELRQALELNPAFAAPHYALAKLAHDAGDVAAAKRHFADYVRLEKSAKGYKEPRQKERLAEAEKALR